MPINEIIEDAVNRITAAVDRTKPDIGMLRRDLTDRADRSVAAVNDGTTDDGWLTVADGDTVAFSPTMADGRPILVNGKSTTFWPRADAARAVAAFRDAVARGAFDDQLVSGGQPVISPKIEGEQLPDDAQNGSMTTGGGRTDADEIGTRFTERLGDRTEPKRK